MPSHNCVLQCYHKLIQKRATRHDGRGSQSVAPQQDIPSQRQVPPSAPPQPNRQIGSQNAPQVASIAPPIRLQVAPPMARLEQDPSHPHQQPGGLGPRNPQQQLIAPLVPQQVAPVALRQEGAPQQQVASPEEQRARPQQLPSVAQRQQAASNQGQQPGGSGPRNAQKVPAPQQRIAAQPVPQQVAPVAPRQEGAPQQVASPEQGRARPQQLPSVAQRQQAASNQGQQPGGSGPRNAQQVPTPQQRFAAPPVPQQVTPAAPRRGEAHQQQVASPGDQRARHQVAPQMPQQLASVAQRQQEASHPGQQPGDSTYRSQQVPVPEQRLAATPVRLKVVIVAPRQGVAPQQQAKPSSTVQQVGTSNTHQKLQDGGSRQQGRPSVIVAPPGQAVGPSKSKQVPPQQRAKPSSIAQREEGSCQQGRPSVILAPPGQGVGPSKSKQAASTAPSQQVSPPVVMAAQRQPNPNVVKQPAGPSNAQSVAPVAKRQVEASQPQATSTVAVGQALGQRMDSSSVAQHQEKTSEQLTKPKHFQITSIPQQQAAGLPLQGKQSQQQEQPNRQAATVNPPNRKREAAVLQHPPVVLRPDNQVEEASPPKRASRVGPKFWDEIQQQLWIRLWGHIARNVKKGRYDLKPLEKGQCPTCRRKLSCGLEAHKNMCHPEIYSLGCPCGYLCSTMRSLNGHNASCDFHQEKFAFGGPRAFLPYISAEWRQCPLFASIVD